MGVGSVDLLHGSDDGDAEDTDQVDGIFALAGLVQDSVGANCAQSQTEVTPGVWTQGFMQRV